jgi:hypothetical protein
MTFEYLAIDDMSRYLNGGHLFRCTTYDIFSIVEGLHLSDKTSTFNFIHSPIKVHL